VGTRARANTHITCLLAGALNRLHVHARRHAHTHAHAHKHKNAAAQANLFLLNKSLALSLPDYVDGHLRVGEELLYADLSLFRRHAIGEKAVHVLLTCPRDRLAYLTIIYPYRS
jgi:hypothetical protein